MEDTSTPMGLERRIQSIAQAIILALVLGCGAALVDLMKSAAKQEERNAQVQKEIVELKTSIAVQLIEIKTDIITLRTQTSNAAIAAALAATTAAAAAAAAASTVPRR